LEDGVAVCGELALLFESVFSVFWWRGLEFFFLVDVWLCVVAVVKAGGKLAWV
jgi:hypothetical protein